MKVSLVVFVDKIVDLVTERFDQLDIGYHARTCLFGVGQNPAMKLPRKYFICVKQLVCYLLDFSFGRNTLTTAGSAESAKHHVSLCFAELLKGALNFFGHSQVLDINGCAGKVDLFLRCSRLSLGGVRRFCSNDCCNHRNYGSDHCQDGHHSFVVRHPSASSSSVINSSPSAAP